MRKSTYKKLSPIFTERYSPRHFLTQPIPEEDLKTMLEAARWTPSCYNEQPWLYLYSSKESERQAILSTLVEANQNWAQHAPVLIMLFARGHFHKNQKENIWAQFDTGASWMSFALQAKKLGYATRAMGGFDPKKALDIASLKAQDYQPLAIIALGKEAYTQEELSSRNPLGNGARPLGHRD